MKPVIGIVLDFETKMTAQGGYSDLPWYALRTTYAEAVAKNDGIPLHIPYIEKFIEEYTELCDGILIPGGEYDIHPSYYGKKLIQEVNFLTNDRTKFELKLLNHIMQKHIPFLGICAGQQLLNVGLGGSLYEDIGTQISNSLVHKDHGKSQSAIVHDIDIMSGTKLSKIFNIKKLSINSHHHQSVKGLGENLIVNAVATDGVIEGIEHTQHPFCIGVVWHPEYETNSEETALFQAFVQEAAKYKKHKI